MSSKLPVALVLLLLLVPCVAAVDYTVHFDPETGTYTHYWFDTSNPPNLYNLFYSLFLPLYAFFGDFVYLIIWMAFVGALWMYTQDITLPFVVGMLAMGIMATLMPMEMWFYIMVLMGMMMAGIVWKLFFGKA